MSFFMTDFFAVVSDVANPEGLLYLTPLRQIFRTINSGKLFSSNQRLIWGIFVYFCQWENEGLVQAPVLIPVHDAASETFLCVQVRQETTPLLGGQNVRLEPSISSCSHKALKWEWVGAGGRPTEAQCMEASGLESQRRGLGSGLESQRGCLPGLRDSTRKSLWRTSERDRATCSVSWPWETQVVPSFMLEYF